MEVDIDNYEEDCGRPCTPNGCMGHDSRIPERITVNGFPLTLEPFAHGDWPFLDEEGAEMPGEVERWKATAQEVETRLAGPDATRSELARKVLEVVENADTTYSDSDGWRTLDPRGVAAITVALRELFAREGIEIEQ